MKNAKTFIAYILVVVLLLGSIAASAQTAPKMPISKNVKGGVVGAVVGGVAGSE